MAQEVFKAVTNFNTGEISPRMMGRIDIDKYANACETLENWVIMPQGGIKTRPGMRNLAQSGGGLNYKSRLIPLEISATENWMAEFVGNGSIRFWKNGALVYTPSAELVLNGNFINRQEGWTFTGSGVQWWAFIDYVGTNPCVNMYATTGGTIPQGSFAEIYQSVNLVAGVTYNISFSVVQYYPTGRSANNRFTVQLMQTSGGNQIQSWSWPDGTINAGQRYTVTYTAVSTGPYQLQFFIVAGADNITPVLFHRILLDDISMTTQSTVYSLSGTGITDATIGELQYAQLGESLYIAQPSILPKRLFRYSDTDWTFTDIKLSPPPTREWERPIPATATINTAVTPNTLTLSAGWSFLAGSSGFGSISNIQVGWGVKYRDGYAVITSVTSATVAQVSIVYPFGTTALPSGSWYLVGAPRCGLTASKWMSTAQGGNRPLPLTGEMAQLELAQSVWRQADIGKYVKVLGGVYKIVGLYSSGTGVPGTIQTADTGWVWAQAICLKKNTSGILQSTNPVFDYMAQQAGGSWQLQTDHWYSGNYPSAVTTYEDRLVFGGTKSHPATIWASGTGDYLNFGTGANPADPLEFSVIAQPAGQIRWLSSSRVLIGGTSNGEIRMSGGSDTPLTPTTVQTRAETGFGTANMVPHKQGQILLFWQRSRKRLMALKFSFESDSYAADDLTILADHIAGGGVYDMDFQREFIPMLWNVKSDGTAASLTFLPDQKVYGWARHITDGVIESVCCGPAINEDRDDVYFVVRRGGNRWIEKFDEGLNLDGFISGIPGGTYTYSQFASKTVSCVCSNGTTTTLTATSTGQITVPTVTGHTWTIGIQFTALCVPVRPEVPIQAGVSQGRVKKWTEVYIRVIDTAGLKVNDEQLPVEVTYNGDVRVDDIGLSQEGYLTIYHAGLRQATVLMAHGTLQIGD